MRTYFYTAASFLFFLLMGGCTQQQNSGENSVEAFPAITVSAKPSSMEALSTSTVITKSDAPYPVPIGNPVSTSEEQAQFMQECESKLTPADISVTANPSAILYDFATTVDELTQKGTRQKSLNQVVLGLTQATLRHEVTWGSDMWVHPNGWACTRPAIAIDLKVGPQHVSIAQEFPEGTCAFNVIAEHELRHVQANQDNLELAAVALQEQMRKFYGTQVLYGSRDSLRSLMDSHVQNNWIPMLKEKLSEVEARHNQIDSPEEYSKNQTVCEGVIPRTLSTRHRPTYQIHAAE